MAKFSEQPFFSYDVFLFYFLFMTRVLLIVVTVPSHIWYIYCDKNNLAVNLRNSILQIYPWVILFLTFEHVGIQAGKKKKFFFNIFSLICFYAHWFVNFYLGWLGLALADSGWLWLTQDGSGWLGVARVVPVFSNTVSRSIAPFPPRE